MTGNDALITAKISAALVSSATIRRRNLDVDTENGVVTLSGLVESEAAKRTVEKIVRDTPGVRGIRNELRIENDLWGAGKPVEQR